MSASIAAKAISMMTATNVKKAAPQVLEKLFMDVLILSVIVSISLLEQIIKEEDVNEKFYC